MKKLNKVLVIVLTFAFTLGLFGVIKAATWVDLLTADNFAVLAGSGITNTGATTITGDIGTYSTLTETGFGSITQTGINHVGDGVTEQAKIDLVTAYNAATGQSMDHAIIADLGGQTLSAGVYKTASSIGLTGTVTLNGSASDVWIFQASSTLTTASNSHVSLIGGAQACNVFWQVGSSATLGTDTEFYGNILALTSITLNTGATVDGRVLARNGAVTLDKNRITKATCAGAPLPGTLHVTKIVHNLHGGTLHEADFSFLVNGSVPIVFEADGTNDLIVSAGTYTVTEPAVTGYATSYNNCSGLDILSSGSATCTITNDDIAPKLTITKTVINLDGGSKHDSDFSFFINGVSASLGVNTTTIGLKTVSETPDSGYLPSSWGTDCDADGKINLAIGDIKTCTITNDDIASTPLTNIGGGNSGMGTIIPPLVDVVKVPSPLALPAGPGPVTYTYTLRNIGKVPVTDIAMVDDSCSPIIFVSGDTNADAKLDLKETWTYDCFKTLSATHTNIVTATGWANGISATDIASATVVVGVSIVPPLIHVTKVPNPFALFNGAGTVTYTYTVTNPGTVPLSNVSITDDKCTGLPGRVLGHPGDLNKNNLLESNESWSFTCKSNLTKTTTNTATASGNANGLTAKDFAMATVVVTNVPGLPKTGFGPENNISWNVIISAGILGILISFYLAQKKQTT